MRQFSGRGGSLYALGDPYRFHGVPMEDCGDGWDWRAPEGLRYWLQGGGLSFEAFVGGEWTLVGAVEVHHRSGRVGLSRCLSGSSVRASGVCLPTTLVASGEAWTLTVEMSTRPKTGLGAESPEYESIVGDSFARIQGAPQPPIELVMARLPSGSGAFVGVGKPEPYAEGTVVQVDSEGVRYGPC